MTVPSLFHAVPERMHGTVLYPLNELRRRVPEAWRRERAKYAGREQLLDFRVPVLDCLWNDALHLSPVHPAEILRALRAAGLPPFAHRFFELDARQLDRTRTVVFLNRRARQPDQMHPAEWVPFDLRRLRGLSRLNEGTRTYFADCAASGARLRPYAYLPHVLHRGPLETRGLPVLEL